MIDPALFVTIIIFMALLFDFLNGFHDAANAIATIVVTKVLTPLQAVILAGCTNFVGYFFFGVAIAKTIGVGIINIESVTLPVIFGALTGAIIWNILTWILGLPTSSSHALIGGILGSGIAASGFDVVIVSGITKICLFIFVAPLLGMLGAIIFTTIIMWTFRNCIPKKTNKLFKRLQLISAALYSVGHGTNDAQKTMGIITMALFSGGMVSSFEIAGWTVFACYTAIALGTMFGGWRIVKTMGTGITKIRPMEGFCAETASALVLIGTAHAGIPVSTTHVISGSIMGVGTVEHMRTVRWVTARKIIWAWIVTIPFAALFSAIGYFIISSII